jgi:hypothetical protein
VKNAALSELFRRLPSVDDVMRSAAVNPLAAIYGHEFVAEALRAVLARLRQEITCGSLEGDALALALPWRIVPSGTSARLPRVIPIWSSTLTLALVENGMRM